jgi:hypothetical protein
MFHRLATLLVGVCLRTAGSLLEILACTLRRFSFVKRRRIGKLRFLLLRGPVSVVSTGLLLFFVLQIQVDGPALFFAHLCQLVEVALGCMAEIRRRGVFLQHL